MDNMKRRETLYSLKVKKLINNVLHVLFSTAVRVLEEESRCI